MSEPRVDEPRAGGPVERYLDELFDQLAGSGAAGRRSLAEAEDHLRTAVADGLARGLDPERAETEAVARFGRPAAIGAQLRLADRGIGAVVRPLIAGGFWIGVVGLLALGMSGLLSELFGRLFGAGFVAGDAPGVTYTPARCADYFEYFPHAATCNAAAALHHWGEVVQGRIALGVLGLLALGGWWLIRRRGALRDGGWRPPATLVALVTTALAGGVAVVLLPITLMGLAFGDHQGAGANIADGSVAAVVAIGAAIWGVRRRARPAAGS
jgi:hypothetical protein